jgi:hypothetical protein
MRPDAGRARRAGRAARAHAGVACVLALLLAGCGEPVPPQRANYVGAWEGGGVFLVIEEGGTVRYRRIQGGSKTSMDAPLKGFVGNDIEVGIGPLTTTFDVSVPPTRLPDRWIMVVDGVTLVRTNAAASAAGEDW